MPRFHASTRKGLFTIERSGRDWSIANASFIGDNCPMMLHDPRDGSLYAALDHGHFGAKMHRSTDGGRSWSEIAAPVYPPKPDDYQPKMMPAEGKPYEWKLKLIWCLEAADPQRPGTLWCGTLPGGLFRSDDFGRTWELNRSLWDDPLREEWFGGGAEQPGIHSICVDSRDSSHITLGISCGGAWVTRDGGRRWKPSSKGMRAEFMPPERMWDENIQDPHRIAQCHANPDVMWAQHHNGIFHSTDGAKSWREIKDVKPSVFGFPAVAHPHDDKTAWFVPAVKDEKRIPVDGRVVVTRTRDGGESFETLRGGLPQDYAYDLVFRHAMDVDDSGDVLAFGSTTGSVWVSEDGGENWKTVSTHLPPVYALRFEKMA